MGQNDPCAAVYCCIGNDLAERKLSSGFVTPVTRNMQAERLVIHMGNPQAFPRRIGIGHTTGEKFAGGDESVQL
jgi:hypothetical protein